MFQRICKFTNDFVLDASRRTREREWERFQAEWSHCDKTQIARNIYFSQSQFNDVAQTAAPSTPIPRANREEEWTKKKHAKDLWTISKLWPNINRFSSMTWQTLALAHIIQWHFDGKSFCYTFPVNLEQQVVYVCVCVCECGPSGRTHITFNIVTILNARTDYRLVFVKI